MGKRETPSFEENSVLQEQGNVDVVSGEEISSDNVSENSLSKNSEEAVSMLTHQVEETLEKKDDVEFEQQFAEEHMLDLGEEHLSYATIEPGDEGDPQEWVVFIGGFSSTKETYKKEMLGLARAGKKVLFVSPDKGIDADEAESAYFQSKEGGLPLSIQHKAAALARLIETLGITEMSVVGHSQGAAVAAAFTGAHPTSVHRLLLDNPAGCTGEDSPFDLYRRVATETAHEVSHKKKQKVEDTEGLWKKKLTRVMHGLSWRLFKEIPDIARTDIRPVLEELKKQKEKEGRGTEIILVNSNEDAIFRKEDIEKGMGEDPYGQYVDRWAMYVEKDATHQKLHRPNSELIPQIMGERLSRPSVIQQLLTEEAGESSEESFRKAA